jgi:hypothetical protein
VVGTQALADAFDADRIGGRGRLLKQRRGVAVAAAATWEVHAHNAGVSTSRIEHILLGYGLVAGSDARSLGTAVLFGMLGVTCFGLIFTPAFYTFIGGLGPKEHKRGVSNRGTHSTSREDREPVVSAS